MQGLIAEANDRKTRATAEANSEIGAIEKQVQDHGCFSMVKGRLEKESLALGQEIEQRRKGLSSLNTKGVIFLVLAFVGGVIGGAIGAMLGALFETNARQNSGNAVFGSMATTCCTPVVVFAVLLGISIYFFHRKSIESKVIVDLGRKVASMKDPDAWKTYVTNEERKLIGQVLEWRDLEKARILDQLRAKRDEIDSWLEESTDNLA